MAKPKGPNKLTAMIDEIIQETTTEDASKPRGPFKAEVINPMTDGNQHLREKEEDGEGEEVIREIHPASAPVTGTRLIKVGDKHFKLVRRDPYGFWYVTIQGKGKVPKELSGAYTNVPDAEKAITSWVNKSNGF